MPRFDPQALKAAQESARQKAELGSNTTDLLLSVGQEVVAPEHPHATEELATRYMGLVLRNPIIASAGPLSQTADGIKALSDGGVGAVVMYSLLEEQIRYEAAHAAELEEEVNNSFAEALSYFPTTSSNNSGLTTTYLKTLEDGAAGVDIPVIASLNGSVNGEWTHTAKQMAEAGAAGIELNVYWVPGDFTPAREVEKRYLDILASVKSGVEIPVAMKLSPFFSSFGEMAHKLDDAGADALVIFNRYLQPDIDLERMQTTSGFELSSPGDARLPRSWIAALFGRLHASLAATSGVESVNDVIKYVLAGADVVMTTAALVRNGADYAGLLVDGLVGWLHRKGLTLNQARGMLAVPRESAVEEYARAGYVSGLEQAKSRYGKRL